MTYIADLDPSNPVTAARIAAAEVAAENLDPREVDPEDRDLVSEDDIILVSQQDRDDLQWVLDWEEYHL